MPGFADLFDDNHLFQKSIAFPVALNFSSATAIRKAGVDGIASYLRKAKVRFQARTIERIVAWSGVAAEPSELAEIQTRQWKELKDVRLLCGEQIVAAEREMAGFLAKTPYVLLLSVTGINVVSAAAWPEKPVRSNTKPRGHQRPRGVVPFAIPKSRGRLRGRHIGPPVQSTAARSGDACRRKFDQMPPVLSRDGGIMEAAKSRSARPPLSYRQPCDAAATEAVIVAGAAGHDSVLYSYCKWFVLKFEIRISQYETNSKSEIQMIEMCFGFCFLVLRFV